MISNVLCGVLKEGLFFYLVAAARFLYMCILGSWSSRLTRLLCRGLESGVFEVKHAVLLFVFGRSVSLNG